MRTPRSSRYQTGVSLLEILISVLIMGIGLLGIAAMQATALRNNQSSMERSQAVIQTYAMLDIMRANRDQAMIGAYNMANWTCSAPAADSRIGKELADWIGQLKVTMGESACGRIQCGALECRVSVQWDDSRGTGAPEDGAEAQDIITVSRL